MRWWLGIVMVLLMVVLVDYDLDSDCTSVIVVYNGNFTSSCGDSDG